MSNIWTIRQPAEDRPLLVLAPMAGYTDSAFRLLCRQFGADIVVSEMVSADAIAYGKFKVTRQCHPEIAEQVEGSIGDTIKVEGKNNNTAELLSFNEAERPFVVQLFGKYPEKFAKAAKWISDELKPDGIDINMGCPARKVVGSDHGVALLKNIDLACEIIKAVKENCNLPVSVKTRLGWQDDDEILKFAPELAAAGIDAITIHGRTYKDGFKGKARWENIYKVKSKFSIDELRIPAGQNSNVKNKEIAVIGNGDVESYDQAIEKSESNDIKLDGIMIGRAAFGRPWIFSKESNHKLADIVLDHAQTSYETKGERGIIEFRKHLLAYTKGLPRAKELRKEAVKIESIGDVEKIVKSF